MIDSIGKHFDKSAIALAAPRRPNTLLPHKNRGRGKREPYFVANLLSKSVLAVAGVANNQQLWPAALPWRFVKVCHCGPENTIIANHCRRGMGYYGIMERPITYTPVRRDGEPGWKLPYHYGAVPSSGNVVVIDPAGKTKLVSRKSLTKH